ncbi:hypothetical protein BDR07DRAFT_1376540 [Suillus spraguei]|nr:hypothetical protein BDR07DRAFT_1376540 [Suillus spraguei]
MTSGGTCDGFSCPHFAMSARDMQDVYAHTLVDVLPEKSVNITGSREEYGDHNELVFRIKDHVYYTWKYKISHRQVVVLQRENRDVLVKMHRRPLSSFRVEETSVEISTISYSLKGGNQRNVNNEHLFYRDLFGSPNEVSLHISETGVTWANPGLMKLHERVMMPIIVHTTGSEQVPAKAAKPTSVNVRTMSAKPE